MTPNALPIFHFKDGGRFVSSQVQRPTGTPFDGMDASDLRTFIDTLWRDAFEAKRAEMERMKLNSLYFDGFHYTNPWQNRRQTIENHVYRIVETQVANTVASRPRPEVTPLMGSSMGSQVAERLQHFATWLMNRSDFDQAVYLAAREKAIMGWSAWITSFDYKTGMPYPKCMSNFDVYPDPAGRNEDECGHFFIGMPVGTARLRATYPRLAQQIISDRIASPSYESAIRPWQEYLENSSTYSWPLIADTAMAVHGEGDPSTEGVALVAAPTERREHGSTTFLKQLIIEDPELVPCLYYGTWIKANGDTVNGAKFTYYQPRTASGWWKMSITAHGCIVEPPKPLDDAYMGAPLTFDRCTQRIDRFWSQSDVDQIIPIQRGINNRIFTLDRALELGGNPPVLNTAGSGLRQQLNNGPVAGGDLLDIARGSEVRYLEFAGVDGPQFERLGQMRESLQSIAGVQDAMEGARPAGIEAAAAIRRLDENALRRLRGRQNPEHRARSLLLRKLMYAFGKKADRYVAFKATDGTEQTVSAEELLMTFTIDFAPGTGTAEGRQDRKDEALALFDRQAIDIPSLLQTFEWPDAADVSARMEDMQLKMHAVETMAKAQAAAQAGGPGGGGGKQLNQAA